MRKINYLRLVCLFCHFRPSVHQSGGYAEFGGLKSWANAAQSSLYRDTHERKVGRKEGRVRRAGGRIKKRKDGRKRGRKGEREEGKKE